MRMYRRQDILRAPYWCHESVDVADYRRESYHGRDRGRDGRMMSLTMPKPRPSHGLSEISHPKLVAEIRRSLTHHWGPDRRVIDVKIRSIDAYKVHGFVRLASEKTEDSFLLDFEATITQQGTLSSLWVGGKKFPLAPARRRSGARA